VKPLARHERHRSVFELSLFDPFFLTHRLIALMASESKASTTAHIEELVQDSVNDSDGSSGTESEPEDPSAAGTSSVTGTSTSKSKRKRAKKAIASLVKGKDKDNIPDELVKEVLQRVQNEAGAEGANAETVRAALEQMKIVDVLKGESGVGGKNKKDTGGHKVREDNSYTSMDVLLYVLF
jgi:glycylpeptide N-tetradecanoyltransferase